MRLTATACAVTIFLAEGNTQTPMRSPRTPAPPTRPQVAYLTPSTLGDDGELLQKAIDSMPGGGLVRLGAGTYHLAIRDGVRAVAPMAHVEIVGEGVDLTRLIVDSDARGYTSVFYPAPDPNQDISGFSLRELTIDQNAQSNPITSTTALAGRPRAIVTAFAGTGIRIENCRFTNLAGTNSLTVNGRHVSNVRIANNRFDQVGNTVAVHYDHSTVYTHGDRVVISGNTFVGGLTQGRGFGATTAIETHGSEQLVVNNVINGYLQGMNITGVADASDNIIVTGNMVTNVAIGIQLWSNFYGTNTTRPALTNVSIAGNTMTLDRSRWLGIAGPAAPVSAGVIVNPNSDAPIERLRIDGNIIRFNSSAEWTASDNQSAGIEMWLVDPSVASRDIALTNNEIVNALGPGIRLSLRADGVTIANNLVRNPGQTHAVIAAPFRSGVMVSHRQNGLAIHDNHVASDAPPSVGFGIYSSVDPASRDLRAVGNIVRAAGGEVLPFQNAVGSAPFFISFETGTTPTTPAYAVAAGSTITDVSDGRVRVQVESPFGTHWRSHAYALEAPTTGAWTAGDIIYNAQPTPGATIGWVCVITGMPGVFRPIGWVGPWQQSAK